MGEWSCRGNAHLNGDYKKISDVVIRNFDSVTTDHYLKYVEIHPTILERLETTLATSATSHVQADEPMA